MTDFEIKEFYGADCLEYKKLSAWLFRAANKALTDTDEYACVLEEEGKARDKDFVRLGAFFDGEFAGAIEIIPFDIYFDGKIRKMNGIGGMVANNEIPKKGAVKALFKKGFEIARQKGQYISHLYPFNADYYRQYGYDVTCSHTKWNIPCEYIKKSDFGKILHYNGSEKMQDDIKRVYREMSAKYNLSVRYCDKRWKKFFEDRKPYVTDRFGYLHYDDNGNADAFLSYYVLPHTEKPQDMYAETLWYTSSRALRGILSYFTTQKAYADRVYLNLPSDIDVFPMIEFQGGWGKRDATAEIFSDGTTRIIDVEKVLEMAKYAGSGSAVIRIEGDEYCPWNNGNYMVCFGESTVVKRVESEPDIIMDIKAFSSGILGRCNLNGLGGFESVKVLKNQKELEKVFYKKNCWINIHF